MKKTILIAERFESQFSTKVLSVISMFGLAHCKYELVHVTEENLSDERSSQMEEDLKRLKHDISQKYSVSLPEISIEISILQGPIVDVFKERTKDRGAALLVLGSTIGNSSSNNRVIRSLIGDISVPVLTIPISTSIENIEDITYATDYKNYESFSLDILITLLNRSDARLSILHIEDDDVDAEVKHKILNQCQSAVITLVETTGEVLESIVEHATNEKVDLLVLLARDVNIIQRFFGNSTADKLTNILDIPILALTE